jgi:carboxyl-terminal processing protease
METSMNTNPCKYRLKSIFFLTIILVAAAANSPSVSGQSNFTRRHAEQALESIKNDIKKNYYDPEFHGIDLEERFKTAKEKLKTVDSAGQMMAIIAQVLLDFDDSHLYFIPPGRTNRTDYGWEMQAFGDQVYVSAVKPGSDAEAKGLKEGDLIISVGGFEPARDNLWKIEYLFRGLRPQPALRLVVQSPDGKQRDLEVKAKVQMRKQIMDLTGKDLGEYIREVENEDRYTRSRSHAIGDDLLIWKLPTFAIEPTAIDSMISRAKKFKTVILDLRGNGGGYVVTCERLTGAFFDKDVMMAETKGRKETKPIKSKRSGDPYSGKLIVLIDNRSASASEIFARVIQIEKRGIVIGDRSAGALMRAMYYPHELGMDIIIPYAVSITDADIIMTDGKSLEKVGVIPDEIILPTASDLAAKGDPVLARAAALAGVKLESQQAGSLFPIEWRK